ncbi:MAG: CDP-alcohol phosphatidyltransferase family protein [Candidatus Aminicenantaceae bacterium]
MKIQGQHTFRLFPKKLLTAPLQMLNPVAKFLVHIKVSPNSISIIALIAGLGAGVLFYFEKLFLAGILIIVCGIFDIIDGKVAVQANKKSLYGAIFDSSLDRYSEFFIYLGIAVYFRSHWALWLTFLAIIGSTMVSYTRARAEGLGIECKVGFMQRAERMAFLSSGTIIGSLFQIFDYTMIIVLSFIALVSNITAIQRILYVREVEKTTKLR